MNINYYQYVAPLIKEKGYAVCITLYGPSSRAITLVSMSRAPLVEPEK